MAIKVSVSLFLLVSIVYFIYCYYKANKIFEKKRQVFVEYLFTSNNIDALKAIGEINPFGVYERRNVPLRKIESYFCSKEEYFTNKTVLQFLNDIDDFKRAYKHYLIPAFILLFVFINIVIGWEKI